MKKLISSLVAGSVLFGANLYHKEIKQNSLPVVFNMATQNRVISIDIKNNKIVVSTNYKVKIFNIKTKELEKTLAFDNIKKVRFSNDGTKLFILTSKKLYIYNNQYKEITHIKGKAFRAFNISNNDKFLAIYDYSNDNIDIYNLISGDKIATTHRYYVKGIKFSPTNKIAVYTNSKVFIYNTNGTLITNLPKLSETIQKIEWIDKNTIDILATTYNTGYVYRFDINTAQILSQTPNQKSLDSFANINKTTDLLAINNVLKTFDFNTKKFIHKYIDPSKKNKDVLDIDLSDNHKLLAIAYNDETIRLYKTDFSTTPKTQSQLKETKPITKEKIVTKIVEKKVYIKDKTNKKPTVEIYASKTSGYTPLKVNFKIIANDEDGKIVSYYINFAGQEAMGKGNPTKPFSYTFSNPGIYKVMVAVKDNKGAIATKQITIKVKEESFNDFKQGLMN